MRICTKCQIAKPDESFPWRNRSTGKRQSRCRECARQYQAEWYAGTGGERHRQAVKKYNKAQLLLKKQYVEQLKSTTPCADCGKTYPPYVMDFDHLFDKEYNVSSLTHWERGTLNQLKREIAKCELVCANCHRIRTHAT